MTCKLCGRSDDHDDLIDISPHDWYLGLCKHIAVIPLCTDCLRAEETAARTAILKFRKDKLILRKK